MYKLKHNVMIFTELIGFIKGGTTTSKSHMKNLLEVALVDDHFDDSEYKLLLKLARKYNVSKKRLNKIKENPGEIKFELPKDENKKFKQFYELTKMMTIDEKILREELKLCKILAKKFGYEKSQELVDAIVKNIEFGLPWQESRKRVALLLT